MTTGRLQCVVNVAAGKETTVAVRDTRRPPPVKKKVLVVGGGPGRVRGGPHRRALRGHDVHLYEMTNQLGGQVRMAASAPHRSDLEAITRWLADEVARLGVHVHLRTPVDPDLVIDAAPDEVIVATGSTPRRGGFQLSSPRCRFPARDLPHVFTSGTCSASAAGRRSAARPSCSTTPARSRRSPWPTSSSPPARRSPSSAGSSSSARTSRIRRPPSRRAANGSSRRGVQFVPAMALREITPTEVVAARHRQRPRPHLPRRHRRDRQLPRPNGELADHLRAAGLSPCTSPATSPAPTRIQAAIHGAAAIARGI